MLTIFAKLAVEMIFARFGVLMRSARLAVETSLARFGVLMRSARLAVETNLARFGVLMRSARLAVLTTPPMATVPPPGVYPRSVDTFRIPTLR